MPAAQAAAFGGRSAPVALPCPASAATVNVREADDVVFAGVWPRLYFDQHKRDDSRILETMDSAKRNICPLAFAEQAHLVAVGDFRRAADHNPVLCPVVVLLQGELFARLDDNALYLEAIPAG